MQFPEIGEIIEFFDLSIIITLSKFDEFNRSILNNHKNFQHNGIEVILIITDDNIGECYRLVENYSLINWKIVRFNGKLENIYFFLNKAITLATYKYVMILKPDIEFLSNVPYLLRYIVHNYHDSFAYGVTILDEHESECNNIQQNYSRLPLECMMMSKSFISELNELIQGNFKNEDIIANLEFLGKRGMKILEAEYTSNKCSESKGKQSFSDHIPVEPFYEHKIFRLHKGNILNDDINIDFEFIFKWDRIRSRDFRNGILAKFRSKWIPHQDVFDQKFSIVALIPIRNEIYHVPDILRHLECFCDGIIVLDDGSTDDSFEAVNSERLILKVSKCYDGYFDDLNNRNLLLELAALFDIDWLFFMDADERFDARFGNLRSLTNLEHVDTVRFNLVHLWDHPEMYRRDLPEGKFGILKRYRMFRNKGFSQIHANRELHFPTVPFRINSFDAPILVKHYGLMDAKVRDDKFKLYKSQDPDGKKQTYDYSYLKDLDTDLGKVKDIVL